MIFRDRREAGRLLAKEVGALGLDDVIVLAIPRGGVPVGDEIASRLGAPLDIIVARKIGAPGYPEYAIGAVSQDGEPLIDLPAADAVGATRDYLEQEVALKAQEVKERMRAYRGDVPYPNLEGKTVVLVDDGIATGSTVRAAIRSIRRRSPRLVVLATPVAPPDTVRELSPEADKVVCLSQPEGFGAVGEFYADFAQLKDSDVVEILQKRRQGSRRPPL
ncbi:MAG TPA: phosphoribosyltransferase family protein [Nitrososphaerales archaeon]|nr:phosphoribosyltransferase family protein [Nitrososphaerales archaeon]